MPLFKKLILALPIMAILSTAWGPVTHQYIAEQTVWTSSDYEARAMYGGAIAPDWCLLSPDTSQYHLKFHSTEYLENLEYLVGDPLEKAFAQAYRTHLISDHYEEQYGEQVSGIGEVPLEFQVDKLLNYEGKTDIYLCTDLMVLAYKLTYPDSDWWPKPEQIELLYLSNEIYKDTYLPEVVSSLSGYEEYISRSIIANYGPLPDFESVEQLKDLVDQYRGTEDYYHGPGCIYNAQYFSWYAGQYGFSVSWVKIEKTEYNKLFSKIEFPKDEHIPNHYICLALVGKYEYLIEPQTGEIVPTRDWAVGK